MADEVPHPLVTSVAQRLLKRMMKDYDVARRQQLALRLKVDAVAAAEKSTQEAAELATVLKAGKLSAKQRETLNAALDAVLDAEPGKLPPEQQTALADALAADADVPELMPLAGYLGGTVNVPMGSEDSAWRILYLDLPLRNWLLVPDRDILFHLSIQDEGVPFGQRDLVWVAAEAPTTRGSAPPRPEVQAQFLRGDFTRAADLDTSVRGGASPAATGVFCEAITPHCCTRHVWPRRH